MSRHGFLIAAAIGLVCVSGCGNGGTTAIFDGGSGKITVNGVTVHFKETATETVREKFETKAAPRVVVEVFAGKIAVQAGPDAAVEAEVTKTAAGETAEEAKEHLKLIDVRMEQDGDTIRITARRETREGNAQDADTIKKQFSPRSADAVVRVPARAALELKSAYGDIQAKGIAGRVEADSTSGSVTVTAGAGEVKLHSAYGDVTVDGGNTTVNASTKSGKVLVRGARGPMDVSSGYGDVTVDGATEKVVAKSNSGNVKVSAAQAPVQLSSGYGSLTVDGAAAVEADTKSGSVHVKGATGTVKAKSHYGDVTVEPAPAGATLETNSGHVRLKGGRGPVQLSSGYGNVDAELGGAVVHAKSKSGHVRVVGQLGDGEHKLESGYGDVALTLPADSTFRLEASTRYGNCKCDFPLQPEGKKNDKQLRGTVGADPKTVLKLTTNSGNVAVRKQ